MGGTPAPGVLGGHVLQHVAGPAGVIDGDRERCLAAGMDDYVSKPVSPTELRTTLAQWVATAHT